MLLEVCGKYSLDDKEAKTLELHVIQVDQEVELRSGQVEAPGRRSVVVLQHWPVIVQHSLQRTGGKKYKKWETGKIGKFPTISSKKKQKKMSVMNTLT